MTMKKFVLAAICAAALPVAMYAAGPAKVGKWESTVEMSMNGQAMPARTVTHCVTEQDTADPHKLVPQGPHSQGDCTMTDVKVDGSTVSWKMSCAKSGMTGDGTITYAADSYTGKFHAVTKHGAVDVHYAGKYVGACDK